MLYIANILKKQCQLVMPKSFLKWESLKHVSEIFGVQYTAMLHFVCFVLSLMLVRHFYVHLNKSVLPRYFIEIIMTRNFYLIRVGI